MPRCFATARSLNMFPQSVLYHGIEDLFAKAGRAGVYIHGYCRSISQLYAEVGEDRANTILDNCNTKLFMRVCVFQTIPATDST